MIYVIFILQIICILATGAGIFVEIRLGADIGYVLITGGAFLFAISTKVTKVQLIKVITEVLTQSKKNKDV